MIESLRAQLRAEMAKEANYSKEHIEHAIHVHEMLQLPATRYIFDQLNQGNSDMSRIAVNMSMAIATVVMAVVYQANPEYRTTATEVMINNIAHYSYKMLAEHGGADNEGVPVEDFIRVIN